jgi:hypothetical protein
MDDLVEGVRRQEAIHVGLNSCICSWLNDARPFRNPELFKRTHVYLQYRYEHSAAHGTLRTGLNATPYAGYTVCMPLPNEQKPRCFF